MNLENERMGKFCSCFWPSWHQLGSSDISGRCATCFTTSEGHLSSPQLPGPQFLHVERWESAERHYGGTRAVPVPFTAPLLCLDSAPPSRTPHPSRALRRPPDLSLPSGTASGKFLLFLPYVVPRQYLRFLRSLTEMTQFPFGLKCLCLGYPQGRPPPTRWQRREEFPEHWRNCNPKRPSTETKWLLGNLLV